MDPGTVDTKMLRAGWGAWGSPVSTATTSFEMLTHDMHILASRNMNLRCTGMKYWYEVLQKRCRPVIGLNWLEISEQLSRDHGSFCCKTRICMPAPVLNTW